MIAVTEEKGLTMDTNTILREQLSRLVERSEAHISFDAAVAQVPAEVRGKRPEGFAHSPWELLEHIRRAQRDIIDFCLEAPYIEQAWPDEYWPSNPEPLSPQEWDECVEAIRRDRADLQRLIADPAVDLFAIVPHGTTQTFLRETLLVADHNAYHLGQLMVLRRLLAS